MAAPRSPAPPLSAVLPPLILGTATFNTQYVTDPLSMPYERIVSRALELGVTAFDTSPYYGPSEDLLGRALAALDPPPPRSSLTLITKAGRVGPSEFDYSPSHIRRSVFRSLRRLRTPYLDLVYAHDVEFVSPAEVLSAVRELRRLRDDDKAGSVVRHVGISGYPVDVLCDLAELVRRETGEPLDAVMSYGHFTVQNRTLGLPLSHDPSHDSQPTTTAATSPLARLRAAGVGVVLNASMLGMGLLTSAGIPPDPAASPPTENNNNHSPLAKWHPSPPALRLACKRLSALAAAAGERLESVAIRWSLGEWARVAGGAGVGVPVSVPGRAAGVGVGASVMGVTSVAELEETVGEWEGVLVGRRRAAAGEEEGSGDGGRDGKIVRLVEEEMWPALGAEWLDYSWASPGEGFVNQREARRDVLGDDGVVEVFQGVKTRVTVVVKETVVSG